jgi:hypothetical protein
VLRCPAACTIPRWSTLERDFAGVTINTTRLLDHEAARGEEGDTGAGPVLNVNELFEAAEQGKTEQIHTKQVFISNKQSETIAVSKTLPKIEIDTLKASTPSTAIISIPATTTTRAMLFATSKTPTTLQPTLSSRNTNLPLPSFSSKASARRRSFYPVPTSSEAKSTMTTTRTEESSSLKYMSTTTLKTLELRPRRYYYPVKEQPPRQRELRNIRDFSTDSQV